MLMRRFMLLAVMLVALLAVGAVAASGHEEPDDEMEEVELETDLSGDEEVPAGDPDGSGEAELDIDVAAGEVCFEIEWEDIAAPTAAHIHEAPAGDSGPAVVGLFGPGDVEDDDEFEACVAADGGTFERIVDDPGAFYVNVHNDEYPGGAIRGQLMAD